MLQNKSTSMGFTYLTVEQQSVEFNEESHWLDMAHLAEDSRNRFTENVANVLNLIKGENADHL